MRPLSRPEHRTAEELVDRHRRLPRVDHGGMWQEADEFFGIEDVIPGGLADMVEVIAV
ncbi:MAG TPA: hypothetical protein VFX16_32255 [Pseudonocardiaceae bacterium]|nr:hypothetical protein [Pseudonocardiaceae bacterium]